MAQTAAVLSTPIDALLDLEWADLLAWHEEAAIIAKARGF